MDSRPKNVGERREDLPMMPDKIRVLQYGLGPIGSAVARHVCERDGLELVAGVDIDAAKVGQDLGRVIGLGRSLGIPVVAGISAVQAEADVVLHTTSSYFDLFKLQLIEILKAGYHVVSSAEELSFPWEDHRGDAEEIDAAARRAGKTVLGTGVNPGFLMDALPLSLTAICQRVERIEVTRAMNASLRRGPFQAKIGSGMTVEAFQAKMAQGRMGHVGLRESMAMLFHTLGRTQVRYESSVEPVVAEAPIRTGFFSVARGQVRGLRQVARGYTEAGEFATLTFSAALDSEEDGDTIRITGSPNLEVKLKGTNGDVATVAIIVNAIRRVNEAGPGLRTMMDIPLVTHW
jgi:4-hydroxy-tetrahydrodipicolinate reductase